MHGDEGSEGPRVHLQGAVSDLAAAPLRAPLRDRVGVDAVVRPRGHLPRHAAVGVLQALGVEVQLALGNVRARALGVKAWWQLPTLGALAATLAPEARPPALAREGLLQHLPRLQGILPVLLALLDLVLSAVLCHGIPRGCSRRCHLREGRIDAVVEVRAHGPELPDVAVFALEVAQRRRPTVARRRVRDGALAEQQGPHGPQPGLRPRPHPPNRLVHSLQALFEGELVDTGSAGHVCGIVDP
mmetsp:Transcript_70552/g.197896  ORF Transcript_70552/g.197896 Transcript_70552/m.197896 type:complete len:243 (+) Transcript_70552:576-1304(+)